MAGSAAPEVPGHPYTLLGVTESPTAGPGGVPRADDADSDVPRYRYTAELAARLERTWQENWARLGTFNVPNPVGSLAPPDGAAVPDDKLFVQDMFPYPRVRDSTLVIPSATSRPTSMPAISGWWAVMCCMR